MKRFFSFFVICLSLTACSDAPDRSAVSALVELTGIGTVRGLVEDQIAQQGAEIDAQDAEKMRSIVEKMKESSIECMYENTDSDEIDWAAVTEFVSVMETIYDDHKERITSGELNFTDMDSMFDESFGGSEPEDIPVDEEVMEAGMNGLQKWQRESKDCINTRQQEYKEKMRAKLQ